MVLSISCNCVHNSIVQALNSSQSFIVSSGHKRQAKSKHISQRFIKYMSPLYFTCAVQYI